MRMRAFLILGAKAGDTAVIRFTKMQGLGNDYIYIKPLPQKSWGTGTTGTQTLSAVVSAFTLVITTYLLIKNL